MSLSMIKITLRKKVMGVMAEGLGLACMRFKLSTEPTLPGIRWVGEVDEHSFGRGFVKMAKQDAHGEGFANRTHAIKYALQKLREKGGKWS